MAAPLFTALPDVVLHKTLAALPFGSLVQAQRVDWRLNGLSRSDEVRDLRSDNASEKAVVFQGEWSKREEGSDPLDLKLHVCYNRVWRTITSNTRTVPNHKRMLNRAVVVFKGEIWFIGGERGPRNHTSNQVDIYNLSSNIWREGPALPEERSDVSCGVVSGTLVVAGGCNNKDHGSCAVTYGYRDETLGWHQLTPMPTGVRKASSCIHDGCLYVFGGICYINGRSTMIQVWNGTQWQITSETFVDREYRSIVDRTCTSYQGDIYFLSGDTQYNDTDYRFETYDLENEVWRTIRILPNHELHMHTSMVPFEDGLLLFLLRRRGRGGVYCPCLYQGEEWQERQDWGNGGIEDFPSRPPFLCQVPLA